MNLKKFAKRSNGKEVKKRILIYSQDKDFSASLTLLFEDEYDVISTSSLSELVEKVKSRQADLLIADSPSRMREIYRDIEDIKKQEPSLHVVLLSVYRSENKDLEINFRLFVDTLIYKPIDITQLSRTVRSLLGNQ